MRREDDPIADKLGKARGAFEAREKDFRDEILKRLQASYNRAVREGNKKLVDRIEAERLAFEKAGALPESIRTSDLTPRWERARAAMVVSYKKAISDYTKKRMKAEADAVEKELQRFIAAGADDGLREGTIWRGFGGHTDWPGERYEFELAITERKGNSFKGIETHKGGEIVREIRGTVDSGHFRFNFTRVIKGFPIEEPVVGTIRGDAMDFKCIYIHNGRTRTSVGQLRLVRE